MMKSSEIPLNFSLYEVEYRLVVVLLTKISTEREQLNEFARHKQLTFHLYTCAFCNSSFSNFCFRNERIISGILQ